MRQEFLLDAIRKDRGMSRLIVNYVSTPSYSPVILDTKITGCEENQKLDRKQEPLPWYPFIHEGHTYLISLGGASYDELRLNARRMDAIREEKALFAYAKLHSNSELKSQGVPFDKWMMESLPSYLVSKIKGWCFIANTYEESQSRYTTVLIDGKILALYQHYVVKAYAVPVVRLPDSVIVTLDDQDYDGSSVEKGLHIFRTYEL